MWFPIIALDGEARFIEARVVRGELHYRPRAHALHGPMTRDLRSLVPADAREMQPHLVHPLALDALSAALTRHPAARDALWPELLAEVSARRFAFETAFVSLRDLLRTAAAHPDSDDARGRAIAERIVRVVTSPWWGEGQAPPDPDPRDDVAGRGTVEAAPPDALRAWRRASVHLPLEDVVALVGDHAAYLEPRERGFTLQLDRLLELLPRLEALTPFADLRRLPGAPEVVLRLGTGARAVSLIRDERRWGLRLGHAPGLMLPPGIGAEIACRYAAQPGDPTLSDDLAALALALGHGYDPRTPITVSSHAEREVQLRWRRGAWQWTMT